MDKSIDVGFTGTQLGLEECQLLKLSETLKLLYEKGYRYLHHGDCVGADAQAHLIAARIGFSIHIHPPLSNQKRAYSELFGPGAGILVHTPKDYLERNQDIVRASSVLIAAPRQKKEQLRSGTWATVRFAQKICETCNKPHHIYNGQEMPGFVHDFKSYPIIMILPS